MGASFCHKNIKGETILSVVQKIAKALGETEETPLAEIERTVKVLGEEKVLATLEETLNIEAEGGMLTDDGARRRSPGGIFFKLIKNQITAKERGRIFGPRVSITTQTLSLTREESQQLSNEALKSEKGELSKVKITLIGRPGRIIEKNSVIITSMQGSKPPNLPAGMPKLPGDPTVYIVYIALKQWNKVKDSITQNPDDKLIIEGYPAFDKRIGQTGTMTIYAQNVNSKLMQQAKREVKTKR